MKIPLRVVVLEPCRDTRESMAALINLWGHEARCAETPVRALQFHREFQPDLMFLNIDMMGMHCLDFVRSIEADSGPKKALLIAISCQGDSRDDPGTADSLFGFQLTKPIEPRFLKDILTAYQQTLERKLARSREVASACV